MNITINLLEVASELANAEVWRECDINKIYVETDDCTVYTEDAQDIFNEWYDHYYDVLLNLREDE